MASLRACDSLLAPLGAAFNQSTERTAQTISMFALAYGVMQLVFGPVGDRFGKIRVIALATLTCSICNLGAALSGDLGELVVARVASGAAAAGIIPLTMAWIGDNVPYARRQEVLAGLLSATVFGIIAGQWAGALLEDAFGWRAVFIVLATVFLVGGVMIFAAARRLDSSPSIERVNGVQRIRTVLGIPWARTILAVTFTEGVFAFGALSFIPTYLHFSFAMSVSRAGGVVALYGVGGLVYSRSAKFMLRRLWAEHIARIGGASLAVAYIALAASPFWPPALLACLFAGFGFHALHNTLQTHATQMAPHARGTAVSLFSSFLFMGQSLGILLAAWLSSFASYNMVFFVSGANLLLLSLLSAHLFHRNSV